MPCTFLCLRSALGTLALIPIMLFSKIKTDNYGRHLKAGLICGIIMCISGLLQQYGIMYTTVGKAGFITALYIIIVPIMGIAVKKRPHKLIWLCTLLAIIGLYFLCIKESEGLSFGDILIFICSIGFALHIMVVDHYVKACNSIMLSIIQYAVCCIVCIIPMLFSDKPEITDIINSRATIAYAGILSTGIGYTLQIVAQKNINPSAASLILSMESVFAVLSGWIIMEQELSPREIFGCILMLTAIIISQLLPKDNKH